MFAPFVYPPVGSEEIATSKVLLAMMERGWEVDVISFADSKRYYPDEGQGEWLPLNKIVHGVKGFPFSGKMGTISWVVKAYAVGRKLAARKQYDFIMSRAAPQFGHLPALFVSRRLGLPWIANWSDPMPPRKAPQPYGAGSGVSLPFLERTLFKAVMEGASWHTFPCERLLRYMNSYMPGCQGKSSVVPHIALKRFCSGSQTSSDVFSLYYAGSLAMRDPSTFLEGVRIFLNERDDNAPVSVTFIGLPLDGLREAARRLGLNDIVKIEEVKKYEAVQEVLAKATVLVIIEADCEEGVFFPSKFVDFVQTGRPILAVSPKTGTMSDILSKGGGIAADCRVPEEIAGAIKALYEEWQTGTLEMNYSSDRLFAIFNEENILTQYTELFKKLGGR